MTVAQHSVDDAIVEELGMTEFDLDATNNSGDSETAMFGRRELRWFQVAALHYVEECIVKHATDGCRILINKPTGVGKTLTSGAILISEPIRKALAKPGEPLRVLYASHMHRLLTQAERAFSEENSIRTITDADLANYKKDPATCTEIYYYSVASKMPSFEFDLVIIDEAHHEAMATIQHHLVHMSSTPIIGLTATKKRPDGMVIKFEHIFAPISREQAVEEGWLAETSVRSILDLSGTNKVPILTSLLTHFAEQMGQTMVFVRTIAEVEKITAHLLEMGHTAVGLTNQRPKELDAILDRFGRGEIQFVVNCKKIGEGVDVAGCTDVLIGRNMGSYTMLNQVIGRAARPDSTCTVWELIDPLGRNLDTTVVVGTPLDHKLLEPTQAGWSVHDFNFGEDSVATALRYVEE